MIFEWLICYLSGVAVAVFLYFLLLHIQKPDGILEIHTEEGKDRYSFVVCCPLDELKKKKSIKLAIRKKNTEFNEAN